MDLRERVVTAVETGGLSCHQAAAQIRQRYQHGDRLGSLFVKRVGSIGILAAAASVRLALVPLAFYPLVSRDSEGLQASSDPSVAVFVNRYT